MPTRVALVTSACWTGSYGDSLRPRMQALGLWAIGWRDFALFTPAPDPALPIRATKNQDPWTLGLGGRLEARLPAGARAQNAGLFLSVECGRICTGSLRWSRG